MKIKHKEFPFSLKMSSDDSPGTIEGYVSVYGNVDASGEKVMPGAFAESLATQKREGRYPLMLWQHDTYEPIGVWDDLSDDGKGLFGKGRLIINNNVPTADKVYALVKNDAVRGLSIGYREVKVEPPSNGEPRKLVQLDLLEASIVSMPANRRARIDAIKSIDEVTRLHEFAQKLRDGEPMPIKEFEDILREAGVPKSLATQIASVGYAKVIRSDSDDEKAKAAEETRKALDKLRERLKNFGR